MIRRLVIIVVISLTLLFDLKAQVIKEQEPAYDLKFKHSYFTGGSLGLQFGSVIMVDVSPEIGYYLLEHISIGAGFTYQYISDRTYSPKVDINVYGGRLFSRLYLPVYDNVFAHLEYEFMAYHTNPYNLGIISNRDLQWFKVNNLYAGAGYRQRFGGRSSINIMVLWNFNESQYTLSSNPIIRIGVDIGL